MPGAFQEDDLQKVVEHVDAFRRPNGRIQTSLLAQALGVPYATMQHRVKHLVRKGVISEPPAATGFEIKSISTQQDKNGVVQKTFVKQVPERGPKFEVPEGHVVKGRSALVDSEGRVLQEWVKTALEGEKLLIDAIKSAFDDYAGTAKVVKPPKHTDSDLLTVYPIADHHLGLFAWSAETKNVDYDLKIAERLLREKMAELVSDAPASSVGIILNLGDFVHADNARNMTEKSGHALDVDTRYAKVLQIGVQLLIDCVEMALQKHDSVIVRCLPGNHDPHTALAMSVALNAFFGRNDRVVVDTDPSRFFVHRFGKVLIAATHGDEARPEQFAQLVAARWPKEWGQTVHRVGYFGHVHHKSKGGGEFPGLTWETFQTLAGKDAWHAGKGYESGRSMCCITHHRERGEVKRQTVNV